MAELILFLFYEKNIQLEKNSVDEATEGMEVAISISGINFERVLGDKNTLYTDISSSQFAPGESEIEVYGGSGYYELENQGAYTSIAPGEWLSWSVTWRATNLPAEVTNAVGSPSLYQFARQLAQ